MDEIDQNGLREMLALTRSSTRKCAGLAQLAERLLTLRDALSFKDEDWYHQLTHQIVTLDSASTFKPASATEMQQVDEAVKSATRKLQRLIGERLI